MPFRLDEHRSKIAFVSSARMPSLVYKACLKTGICSNTAYYQRAICEALARDLDIPLEELLAELPPARSNSKVLFGDERRPVKVRPGPANTVETVR